MPENLSQWLWYGFFFGGALGGWVLMAMCAAEVIGMLQRGRKWRDEA